MIYVLYYFCSNVLYVHTVHTVQYVHSHTGAEIQTIGNELMSVFAPSHEAMEEAKERIEALLKSDDVSVMGDDAIPCTHRGNCRICH